MAYLPLSVPSLKGNELRYVSDCIATEWVSSVGAYVSQFEKKLAEYVNANFAVACVNGTSALHVSLLASGIQPQGEVIVPTVSFIATANVVKYCSAYPLFMDCDDGLNLDVEKLEFFLKNHCEKTKLGLRNKETGRIIQAIIPVHVFGYPADMKTIVRLATEYHLTVIEDATESLGSHYLNEDGGKKFTGTLGLIGCFSFNGNKLITTGGGGMMVTQDQKTSQRLKYLTTQAKDDELYFVHNEVGYNYRLTNIQAAVGLAQLEQIDLFIETKRKNLSLYKKLLDNIEELSFIEEPKNTRSNCWHYALIVANSGEKNRDGLMACLKENHIESRPIWRSLHCQKPFHDSFSFHIEKANYYADKILNIPCSSNLRETDVERVAACIQKYYGRHSRT